MFSTIVGSLLLLVRIFFQIHDKGLAHDYYVKDFESFAGAFGTILFAFGGASAFPNFQNDMKKKEQFPLAVIIGFSGKQVPLFLKKSNINKQIRSDLALPTYGRSRLRNLWQVGGLFDFGQLRVGNTGDDHRGGLPGALPHGGAHCGEPSLSGP